VGQIEFHAADGHGGFSLLNIVNNVGTTWSTIQPIAVGELRFYDGAAGVGEFQTTDDRGNMTVLQRYANWRTSWTLIRPGSFS